MSHMNVGIKTAPSKKSLWSSIPRRHVVFDHPGHKR